MGSHIYWKQTLYFKGEIGEWEEYLESGNEHIFIVTIICKILLQLLLIHPEIKLQGGGEERNEIKKNGGKGREWHVCFFSDLCYSRDSEPFCIVQTVKEVDIAVYKASEQSLKEQIQSSIFTACTAWCWSEAGKIFVMKPHM